MTTGCIYFRQLRVWLPVLLCNSTDAPRLSRWALHQVHVLFAGSLQSIMFKWRRKTFCRNRKAASILPMGSQGPITKVCSLSRQTRPGQRSCILGTLQAYLYEDCTEGESTVDRVSMASGTDQQAGYVRPMVCPAQAAVLLVVVGLSGPGCSIDRCKREPAARD